MSLFNADLFTLAVQRMRHSAARQQVIAENVANADTPGYRARDIAAFEFKREMRDVTQASATAGSLARTDVRHLPAAPGPEKPVGDSGDTWELLPSGNSVAIEQQMLNMTETKLQHDQAATYYRKALDMVRAASSGRF